MSWSERYVRNHKQQTDRAVGDAYARFAMDPTGAKMFDELLHCVRRRAPRLLRGSPVQNGYHCGVEALVNLCRFRRRFVRRPAEWSGALSSWRPAVSSLAHHLLCRYEVPVFLTSCWYSKADASGRHREWFIAHGHGAKFRSL